MSDNYVNLLINEKIPIQNELNLEQHKKSVFYRKKKGIKRKPQKKSINKNQKEIHCERKIENVGKHGKKSLNSTISMIE